MPLADMTLTPGMFGRRRGRRRRMMEARKDKGMPLRPTGGPPGVAMEPVRRRGIKRLPR